MRTFSSESVQSPLISQRKELKVLKTAQSIYKRPFYTGFQSRFKSLGSGFRISFGVNDIVE